MSLKAKIEAVIYAAEEPVTLAQLAALFQPELVEQREPRLAEEKSADGPAAHENPTLVLETDAEEAHAQSDLPAETPEAPVSAEDAEKRGTDEEKKAARQRDRETREEARRVVAELVAEYNDRDRGMEIREIAGGYRVATKPEYHDAVRAFVKSLKPPMKLSLQALETLAVIAYKQPVTAPEV